MTKQFRDHVPPSLISRALGIKGGVCDLQIFSHDFHQNYHEICPAVFQWDCSDGSGVGLDTVFVMENPFLHTRHLKNSQQDVKHIYLAMYQNTKSLHTHTHTPIKANNKHIKTHIKPIHTYNNLYKTYNNT